MIKNLWSVLEKIPIFSVSKMALSERIGKLLNWLEPQMPSTPDYFFRSALKIYIFTWPKTTEIKNTAFNV